MKRTLVLEKKAFRSEMRIPGKEDLEKLLKQHFGHSKFRGKQLQAIEAVLQGRDCFCLMPTGGGKSMCYQIPALAKSGIVLVISPLIALMENQVAALKEKGICAEFLSSTQSASIKEKIHEDLNSGKPSVRLLYVTPELINTSGFMAKLAKLNGRGVLSLIAIDEAHCISAWGHDFRPSYRKLSSLRNNFPDVPIIALTATAAPKVQKDVIQSLCLQQPLVLRASFNRPNIYYEVRYKDLLDSPYKDLSKLLKSSGNVCSIIYCLERSTCDDLSNHLVKDGISSTAYHAGLTSKLRTAVLEDWLCSRTQVIVATVAFGMGIDRKDVRIVCHFNIPKSMEAFYQESGRAGRDQLPTRSIVYYGLDDRKRMEFILSNAGSKKAGSSMSDESLKKAMADFSQIVEYCDEPGCRRSKILKCFGEQVSELLCHKSCDACKHPNLVSSSIEEVHRVCSIQKKGGPSPIFFRSSDDVSRHQHSEFWAQDNDTSNSNEDISDSDEEEIVSSSFKPQISSKSNLEQKLDYLQRAEELYYHNKCDKRKVSSEKNTVSESTREASSGRILNALKQAHDRLGKQLLEPEVACSFLEMECYKKYGKVGRTFYNSQVAATTRWLSSATLEQIRERLGANHNHTKGQITPGPLSNDTLSSTKQSITSKPYVELQNDTPAEQLNNCIEMETPRSNVELPPILSFEEYATQQNNQPSKQHEVPKSSQGKRMKWCQN